MMLVAFSLRETPSLPREVIRMQELLENEMACLLVLILVIVGFWIFG